MWDGTLLTGFSGFLILHEVTPVFIFFCVVGTIGLGMMLFEKKKEKVNV